MDQPHEYRREEHRVHLMISHLLWCPRRGKPVLVGPVAARCRQLIEQKWEERGREILAMAIPPDDTHWFVWVTPSDRAAQVIKACKGITSFPLRRAFPDVRTMPAMGTRSSFRSTAGTVSQQTMQRSIDAQKGH